MIFDTFCFFNHSCSPNVFFHKDRDRMTIITSRPVRENEQLCNNYRCFDENTNTEKRRASLDIMHDLIKDIRNPQREPDKFEAVVNRTIAIERSTTAHWTPLISAFGLKYRDLLSQRYIWRNLSVHHQRGPKFKIISRLFWSRSSSPLWPTKNRINFYHKQIFRIDFEVWFLLKWL